MSFDMKDMTQGGQLIYMRLRMLAQIMNIMFYWLVVLFMLSMAGTLAFRMSWQNFINGFKYWWCASLQPLQNLMVSKTVYDIQYYGHVLKYTAQQVLSDAYTVYCGKLLLQEVILGLMVSGTLVLIAFLVAVWVLGRHGKKQSEDEITGGRTLTDDPKSVTRLLKRKGKASDIMIGALAMVKNSEVQNFGIHGSVGTGKSRAFRAMMDYARKRGDLAIVYDKGGTFTEEFYDPSVDHILNPLDQRCANWDLWSECITLPDFESVANTLIPMGTSDDPFWQGSARTIFSDGSYRMKRDTDRSYWKLINTLLGISLKDLRAYLQETPSANLVASEIEKTAISIRSVLTNYVKALRYLVGTEKPGKKFTIRDWMRNVKDGETNGWLFITSDSENHTSLKPVISAWLSIAVKSLMAMGPNPDRRVWFFLDELPTLHKLPDLIETIAEARKFGGCFVLGFQSYAQLESIYGDKPAAAMFDTLNTRFFFRNPSNVIAEWVAKELGEKERNKASQQYSYGADPVRDGVSVGKDEDRTQLVSYSDIQSLDDLMLYVTLPGPYPVIKITLKYKSYPKVAEGFVLRQFDGDNWKKLNNELDMREAQSRSLDVLFAPTESQAPSTDVVASPLPVPVNVTSARVATNNTAVSPESGGTGSGKEQDIGARLPPGVDETGEITDMALYEEYAGQQEGEQQKMAQREEVNINHSQQDRGVLSDEPRERLI